MKDEDGPKTEKTPHVIRHMLSELDSPVKDLTKWERDFVISVTDWFNRRGNLTDKQFEVLEKIYAEKSA